MTTQTQHSKGRAVRKSLADQIDRLDTILDGLADALNESVAQAVRDVIGQAVSEAVQAAVTEVLSSHELLRAALARHEPPEAIPVPPPAPEPRPTLTEKLKAAAARACAKVKEAASQVKEKVRQAASLACAAGKKVGKAAQNLPATLSALGKAAWALRRPCAVAVGVGVLCGAACYCGGRVFSSVANGMGGAALTLSAMVLPLRRLLPFGNSKSG
jgi:flagellar biosynthesis/type III secretory pathway protein FliH